MFFNPISVLFFVLFLLLLFGLFFFVQIGVLTLAFAKICISPQYMFALLFFTLVGSGVNIPIKRIRDENLCEEEEIRFYGMRYRLPPPRQPCTTVLAVYLGGAVIPVFAEDLGYITPDVREVMSHFELPGMRAILFAFGESFPKSIVLPHHHVKNYVVYT